jgi:DinB superfamily/Pentapeptide repeats (8 copies)
MRFENTDDLKDAEFVNVDLSGARGRNVNLSGVRMMEAMLVNARFSGLISGLVINDVEVAPLITAEMDRRYPERIKLRPTDAEGAREAWSVIEGLWAATKERARGLPEPLLHERVDDEWSFLETLRHLIFVTDGWISRTVLGRSRHFCSFGVLPTFITDASPFGIDPTANPSVGEVVAVREDRMAVVRTLVTGMTDARLHEQRGEHTVLRCLLTLFDEEWHHNWYANRDLDTLTG